MTMRECRLWSALYDIDPWGPERMELMLAQMCAVIANAHAPKGNFKVGDFLPRFEPEQHVERTDEELKDLAIKANAIMGGRMK